LAITQKKNKQLIKIVDSATKEQMPFVMISKKLVVDKKHSECPTIDRRLSFEILTKLFKYKANEPVYKKV